MTADLSPTEAATVARFEAAQPAPESWGGDGLREESEKRLDALIRVRRERDALRTEVAALRAKAAAADRVRELTDRWLRLGNAPMAIAVRRALDGPDRTDRGRC